MRPEVEEWAQRQLAAFPPLTPSQCDTLAALFGASREPDLKAEAA